MTRRFLTVWISGAVLLAAACVPAMAHHYMAEWDRDNPIMLTGTVKDWQWTNPHTWLIMVATDDKGQTKEWSLEGTNPTGWKKVGVLHGTIKAGDKVVVRTFPAKDGSPQGGLGGILTINGAPGPGNFELPANEGPPKGGAKTGEK